MRGLTETALRRQSSVFKFDWHNLRPFNHLRVTKTPVAFVYFLIGAHKC